MDPTVPIPFDKLDPLDLNPCPDYIVSYVKQNAKLGDSQSVIDSVDEFGAKYARRSMHIGPKKGVIVDKIVQECNPIISLEFGAFYGYSAVRFARLLSPGAKYFSIEINPHFVKLSKEIVKHAGLEDRVFFIEGSTEDVIPQLRAEHGIDKVDFVFIDHWKNLYKPDVIRLEENKLIRKGSVIAADNVLFPGAPDYLEYVRNSPHFVSTFFESTLTHGEDVKDGIERSVYCG